MKLLSNHRYVIVRKPRKSGERGWCVILIGPFEKKVAWIRTETRSIVDLGRVIQQWVSEGSVAADSGVKEVKLYE